MRKSALLLIVGTILVLGCFSLFVSRFFPTQVSLSGISLQRSIGQMIVTGFSGDTADAPDFQRAVRNLEDGIIGGVLFLPNNIASKQELEQMLKTVHDCTCAILPLIAIDEEGGVVDRLGEHAGFIHIPSPADVQREGIASARTKYDLLAKELVGTGFNLNLAPVVDLNINPENPIIGLRDRSYSDDPETVTAFARAFIEAHRASGVLTSLKHFPGHGSSTADSHTTIVDVGGTWSENELLPYKKLINGNLVDTIMIGHLLNLKRWGGISSQEGTAIHDLLRQNLNYDGVTISDDLGMGGVGQDAESFADVITSAVKTGIDIVLIAHPIDEDTGTYANSSILADLKSGALSNNAIQSSFRRIAKLKRNVGFGKSGHRSSTVF